MKEMKVIVHVIHLIEVEYHIDDVLFLVHEQVLSIEVDENEV
jgi:hypothetical protein